MYTGDGAVVARSFGVVSKFKLLCVPCPKFPTPGNSETPEKHRNRPLNFLSSHSHYFPNSRENSTTIILFSIYSLLTLYLPRHFAAKTTLTQNRKPSEPPSEADLSYHLAMSASASAISKLANVRKCFFTFFTIMPDYQKYHLHTVKIISHRMQDTGYDAPAAPNTVALLPKNVEHPISTNHNHSP